MRGRKAVGALLLALVARGFLGQRLLLDLVIRSYMTYVLNTLPLATWQKDMAYWQSLPRAAYEERTFGFEEGDGHTVRVCKLSMYLKFAEELNSGLIISPLTDRAVTLPPPERAKAYVEACRETFEALPREQRSILEEQLNPVPWPSQFVLNVTHPWLNGPFTQEMFTPWNLIIQRNPGVASPPGMANQWTRDREASAAVLPSLEGRLKPREELERTLPAWILRGLDKLRITPVQDDTIDVEEIPEALLNGKTAVFDATKLCGTEVFNQSIPDIARHHGEMAHSIPAFKLMSAGYGDNTYDSLAELAHRFSSWDAKGWQDYPDFGPFPTPRHLMNRDQSFLQEDRILSMLWQMVAWFHNERWDAVRQYYLHLVKDYRQCNSQTTINVRRLPNFKLKDMYEAMGRPSWVQRLWNLLWIGPVGDFWHFDEEDNLLIGISGNIYVAVMEQHVTDIVSGTRNVGLGWNNLNGFFYHPETRSPDERHWVDDNPWVRKMPIHFLKLEPGMGITVPSRTYHNVMALDGNRVLMNCFFMPKWRALEGVPAANNSWYKPGSQTEVFRAMWNLKAASIWRLWDTRKVGGFFAGFKLEFI